MIAKGFVSPVYFLGQPIYFCTVCRYLKRAAPDEPFPAAKTCNNVSTLLGWEPTGRADG